VINHARTLLLNHAGPRIGTLGEEYVPLSFAPLDWPDYALAIRRTLFGATPDRTMELYRTRMLMQLLHSCELEEFVLALDPRITYDIDNDRLFATFNTLVTPAGVPQLFLVGNLGPPDLTGICEHRWTVDVLDETRARIRRTVRPAADITAEYTTTNGLSSLLTLPQSLLQCQFHTGLGGFWTVTGTARPQDGLPMLITRLEALPGAVFTTLFGVTSGKTLTEPFKTFYAGWTDHPELPYRLACLLMALIYRLEELRVA
jgi:hypothetical protein